MTALQITIYSTPMIATVSKEIAYDKIRAVEWENGRLKLTQNWGQITVFANKYKQELCCEPSLFRQRPFYFGMT